MLPDGGRADGVDGALVENAASRKTNRLAFRVIAQARAVTVDGLGRIVGGCAAQLGAALDQKVFHLHGGRRRAGVAQQARLDTERRVGVDADAVPHAQHVLTLLAQHSGLHRAPKTLLQNRLVHGHDHLLSAQVDGLTW